MVDAGEQQAGAPGGFSIGGVLAKGFRTLFRNFASFMLMALLFLLVPAVLTLLMGPPQDPFGGGQVLLTVIQALFGYLLTAALVYGTIQSLRSGSVSLGAAIAGGLQTFLPVIAVAIVVGLAVGVGLVLLVVPGFIVLTILWVAIPAAVVERPGVGGALRRSAELTKGYRWQVFAIVIIIGLLQIAVGAIVGSAFQFAVGFFGLTLIGWVVNAFMTALNAVMISVGYHDLRIAKEGGDTGQIAQVFD